MKNGDYLGMLLAAGLLLFIIAGIRSARDAGAAKLR